VKSLELLEGALVSTLEGKGAPSMVERTLIAPPMAQVGPIELSQRQQIVASSILKGKYDQPVDPESAYEMLAKRAQQAADEAKAAEGGGGILDMLGGLFGTTGQRKGSMTTTQRVTREVTSVSPGRTSEGRGTSSTSSKVRATLLSSKTGRCTIVPLSLPSGWPKTGAPGLFCSARGP